MHPTFSLFENSFPNWKQTYDSELQPAPIGEPHTNRDEIPPSNPGEHFVSPDYPPSGDDDDYQFDRKIPKRTVHYPNSEEYDWSLEGDTLQTTNTTRDAAHYRSQPPQKMADRSSACVLSVIGARLKSSHIFGLLSAVDILLLILRFTNSVDKIVKVYFSKSDSDIIREDEDGLYRATGKQSSKSDTVSNGMAEQQLGQGQNGHGPEGAIIESYKSFVLAKEAHSWSRPGSGNMTKSQSMPQNGKGSNNYASVERESLRNHGQQKKEEICVSDKSQSEGIIGLFIKGMSFKFLRHSYRFAKSKLARHRNIASFSF